MNLNILFEQKQGLTFYQCLMICANNVDLISEFNRLKGFKNAPIDFMVDITTGYYQEKFIHFVYDYVWSRFS